MFRPPDGPEDAVEISDKDLVDFLVMTVAVFTILYLGSLAQRMGAV